MAWRVRTLVPESGRVGFESSSGTSYISSGTALNLSDLLFLYKTEVMVAPEGCLGGSAG